MKKHLFAICTLLVTLASGCTQDEMLEKRRLSSMDKTEFNASFENVADSRTYMEEDAATSKLYLRWTKADEITIFRGNTLNQRYQFKGETGDNSGSFRNISSDDFVSYNDLDEPCNYAIYPYNEYTKITEKGVMSVTLPAVQQYAEKSFGLGANTMVAVTQSTGDVNLAFKNVGGFFKFKFYGKDLTIKSVSLQGNNDEKLAGKASMTSPYGSEPAVTMDSEATKILTLDCGDEGVKVGSTKEEATEFWFALPPTKFTKGFTITVTDTEGGTFTKTTEKTFEIKRNTIKPISAIEVETVFEVPFTIKQKEYTLPLTGCKFTVQISHQKPYKILSRHHIDEGGVSLATDTVDMIVYRIGSSTSDREGYIVISNEEETYKDTIVVKQQQTSEELHNGYGNSPNGFGMIMSYLGGTPSFDIYTNVDKYDIAISRNSTAKEVRHVSTEKTDFGFRESFEIPTNVGSTDSKYSILFIGPNITFVHGVTVRRQLFVYFNEPDEMHISEEGETFTTHAWTEDNNLNIKLEGEDTSWLTVKETDDTYVDGVRRINTTFVAEPNKTGKTRELRIVAFNGFNDNDVVRIIQPSGEGVLLSKEKMIVGAWKQSQSIILKDCEYTIEADGSAPWITVGQMSKGNGAITQYLEIEANKEGQERNANLTIKSGDITHTLKVRQLPESGSLTDDSPEQWKTFTLPPVQTKNPYPNETGSMLYFSIVEDPQTFIHIQSRKVLDKLYFTPEDEFIPQVNYLEYVLDNFNGVSYCGGGGGMKLIALSNQYVEQYYNSYGAKALVQENRGVLYHELTHAFQLEPQGCGDYSSSKVFHSCIEGMADAVRTLCGGFPNESDRPKGGHYLDSYRYTGFFIVWLVNNKDKDFLRKFNLSTQYVIPWSFDGAIKYILGEQYNVDDLWTEYLKAMGDIQ